MRTLVTYDIPTEFGVLGSIDLNSHGVPAQFALMGTRLIVVFRPPLPGDLPATRHILSIAASHSEHLVLPGNSTHVGSLVRDGHIGSATYAQHLFAVSSVSDSSDKDGNAHT